ncbi:MAG: hypothetical protein ACE5KW_04145 [Dehalococcoidia bacterium]
MDRLSLARIRLIPDAGVTIDLGHVRFIKPPAVIGVLMLIEQLSQMLREGELRVLGLELPRDRRVVNYLYRIGFDQVTRDVILQQPPPDFIFQDLPGFRPMIPVSRFSQADHVEGIANRMAEVFHTELIGLGTLLQQCHVVFSELADNVLHHSRSGTGYVLAQQYRYPRKGGGYQNMIEVAVGDAGIGMYNALAQNPEVASQLRSDEEAIVLALKDGVTGLSASNRGYGLGYVQQEVRRGKERVLGIRSRTGWVKLYSSGRLRRGTCELFSGTLAHVVIPCG